jgi:isopentenyldiphosphate isomerase
VSPELIAVVDERNRFVRWESRAVVHRDRLPHRSIHVLVSDSAGNLIVQRRHRDKLTWPRTWDTSVAGHVELGDYPDPARPDDGLEAVYAAVAARELREELGVEAALEPLGVHGPEPGVHYEFLALYRAVSDGPYRLQPEEVEELRAVAPDELRRWIAAGSEPVTSTLRWLVSRYTR